MPDENTYFTDDEDTIESGTPPIHDHSAHPSRRPRSQLAVVAGMLCMAAGSLIAAATLVLWSWESDFIDHSGATDAVVSGLKIQLSKSSSNSWSQAAWLPILEFTTPEGNLIHAENNVARPKSYYSVGDHVHVLYNPREPELAQIDGFGERWGFVCWAGVFASIFLSSGLCLMSLRKAS